MSEAGPSRKRARTNDPAAPARTVEDVKPSVARNEDLEDLEIELDSIQGRAQIIQARIKALKASDPSQRVKRERRDIDEDAVYLIKGNVKRERFPIRLEASGDVIDLTLDD